MNTRPDVEDLQTTRTEKLLAVVLTAFLLVGGIWTYTKLDDVVRGHVRLPTETLVHSPAVARQNAAQQRVYTAHARSSRALQNLELRREAYRTALDANKPAGRLERDYEAAQSEYETAQRQLAAARAQAAAAAPAAEAARRNAQAKVDAAVDRQERYSFLVRLAFELVAIAFAYWLLAHLRRRGSRWFPLAGSAIGFAVVMSFVLAGDYVTDYAEPYDWGIAILALFGIAATLLAYLLLQRYLLRRVPQRRVRRGQCPFCGYPVSAGSHCEGCGREVVAPCAHCEAPRRVGTAHCGACGATS